MSASFDDHLRDMVLGFLIPGIVLSAMVLMAFAYTSSQSRSRPYLNRVSFRLLVYAMISNFILSVTLIPMEMLMKGPISPAECGFAAFASNASLLFSACMYSCMAINLQLVLIHRVNGLKMEKYYVIGSSLLVGFCTIVPLAAGQFQGLYDNLCWYSNPDPVLRFRWIVGTQTFWMLLMASSELICFVILILYMLRRLMSMKRIRSDISASMTTLQHATYSVAPILQFRRIILRITLYPVLSCILNLSGSILDLYLAKHLENTDLNFRLYAVDQCIFNARPFLYGLLAATDPSFIRAIGALRNPHPSTGSDNSQSSSTTKSQFWSSFTISSIYKQTLTDRNKTQGESTESMVMHSLNAPERSQQTEVDVLHTHTHRDPEEGMELYSNVEGPKDGIEHQI
ncbi:hypothetical protein MVEN_02383700 [Mycena venus]|uniref:Uncharacterized protein n=1 Tax=Mycena venus TaxID=2733690 RepID=A0A8H6X2R3_9AGAR|nr:hypothetical protein MVEN_02383700 [Mycena venus]